MRWLLPILIAFPAAGQAPQSPEVVEVRIAGVRALDPALVRAAVTTRPTRCRSALLAPVCALGAGEQRAYLDSAAVRRDEARIDSLYAASGFPRARTRAAVERRDGGVAVRFEITEGPPLVVRSLAVTGVETLRERVATPPLPLRVGEPYSLAALEASQRVLARAAAEQGYAFARVEVGGELSADTTEARVVLELVPGRPAVFGPTFVRAGAPLRERDVRRRLAYRPGEPFRPAALERTAERLYDLPIVQSARILPRPGPGGADSVVTVDAVVEAGRATAYGLDAVVSGSSCVGGTLNLASRYFLGAPREVSISAGGSNLFARQLRRFPCTGAGEDEFTDPDYFVRAELREPAGTEGRLLLDAAFERQSAARAYVRRGARGRIGYARLLGHGVDALLAFAPERSDNEAAGPFFCGLRGACGGGALATLTGTRTLAPLEAGVGWRSRGPQRLPPGPRPGAAAGLRWSSNARVSLAGAGALTGSDLAFGRMLADASVTRFLGVRADVMVRMRAGALLGGGELPPHLRFYGGGPAGVRGVAANLLGARLLVVREEDVDEIGCALVAGACEGLTVDPDRVFVRGAGGDALVEATVEGRVWASRVVQLAAFVDLGAVRSGGVAGSPLGPRTEALVTPGIGIGVVTPVAPVRLDVAYNSSPVRRYPLLARHPAGEGYVPLGSVVYDPFAGEGWARFRRRLQLQFSVMPGF